MIPDGPADALGLRDRLYAQAFRLARLGAWECDLVTERLTWTDGVYDLFGLSTGSPLKRAATVALYEEESRRDMELLRAETIRTGQGFTLDARIRGRDGERRWMRLTAELVREDGRAVRLFGAKQDITAERAVWDRLRAQAERDPLTGLANRAVFEARYRAVTGDTLNHAFVAALLLIDLDHFKAINDRLGHAAGDEGLRQTAMRLTRVFPDAVLVARIGGDEFAVLLPAPLGPARLARMLDCASRALCRPIPWNGTRLALGASIGATLVGGPQGRGSATPFAQADQALYAAKAAGRNTVRVFGAEAPVSEAPAARDGRRAAR